MLRWVGGCAVVVIVLAAIGIWTGYRKVTRMAEAGPRESVIVRAPAERVFAMVANADSLPEWRMEGLAIRASRSGMLQAGDSLVVQSSVAGRSLRSTWHVSAVVPNVLIAFQMRSDTGSMIATRTDSVIALGDSTRLASSVVAALIDSVRSAQRDSGEGTAIADMTSKIFITAARMQTRAELLRLKTRVEGDSTAARPRR